MSELLQIYWPLIVVALVIGVAVAWYVFHASRKTRVSRTGGDVLDEGAERAQRNTALIDSAPASAAPVAAQPAAVPVEPVTAEPVPAEPVAAAEPAQAPAPAAAPAPSASTPTAGDDLTRIKGLGPKLAATLREQGVTSFAQIAAWDEAAIDRVDAGLGRFQGRIRRDDWVGQAQLLAAGDDTGFADRYGKITK